MKFTPTQLAGATIVEQDRRADARGYFTRMFCEREFAEQGLPDRMVQTNLSFTQHAGTLRGLHFQDPAEDKLVCCVEGAIWDVIVDIRRRSPTYCRWLGFELSASNGRMLLVPKGFAHGFIALTDRAVVCYGMSEFHTPGGERGACHDDPAFAIQWPVPVTQVSDKDRSWPRFSR